MAKEDKDRLIAFIQAMPESMSRNQIICSLVGAQINPDNPEELKDLMDSISQNLCYNLLSETNKKKKVNELSSYLTSYIGGTMYNNKEAYEETKELHMKQAEEIAALSAHVKKCWED